jgi:putative NADH-flavin reductase
MQAMRTTGARRLMVVSGSIVADEGESFYLRYLIKPVARRTFLRHASADFAATEADVHASGLDWTIFRPPSLNDKPAKGTYRTAIERHLPHCFGITRRDLAACMVRMLEDPATIGKHVCVAN